MRTPAILPTGRNLHGFDPYRIPSAFALADGAARPSACSRAMRGRPSDPGDRRRRAVGRRQSEERRRPDRPGAGSHRRRAALRRLWPAVRRGAHSAGDARPPAHRHRRDALRHLPRPAAAADPVARRGLLAGGDRRRARGQQLRSQARAGVPGATRLRSRDRGAAGVLQRRRRLWRQRRHADRLRRLERRGRNLQHLRAAQVLRLRPQGRRDPRSSCCESVSRTSISPIRISTASNSASPRSTIISTASAASAARRRARAAARRRSTSATRRAARARCAR